MGPPARSCSPSTPDDAFDAIVPFLVLGASLLLLVQPWIEQRLGSHEGGGASAALHTSQFLAGVYGGYFGAGLGVILLAFPPISGSALL